MSPKMNETKKRILTLSLELIKEHGYDQVTLNDICKAADVSKHTFYYYFSSKEALLMEFFTIPREISVQRLASLLATENYFDQYWKLMEPGVDFFIESGIEITKRIIISNLQRELKTFSEPEFQRDLVVAEIMLIKKAQEAGEIRNQSEAFSLVWSAKMEWFGMLMGWCMSKGAVDLKHDLRTALEVIFDVEPSLRKGNFERVIETIEAIHKKEKDCN